MDADQEMVLEWQCARLINRYANLNDAGDWPAVAALFTDDGTLIRPSAPEIEICGRDHILAALQSRPPRASRHFITNIEVHAISPDCATATSAMMLYSGSPAHGGDLPTLDAASPRLGGFEDELQCVSGRWLFKVRRGCMYFR